MIHIYIMYLPISEKNDGNRTGQKHRTEHKAGTELLAVGLRELYGMELNRAGLSYGQHGKPYLRNHPEIHFNISHCEGLDPITTSPDEAHSPMDTGCASCLDGSRAIPCSL